MLCTESPRIAISPQAWGCTVHAHAIAPCFEKSPHKRGDVPLALLRPISAIKISPQAWGCTDLTGTELLSRFNLPTSVGMYRTAKTAQTMPE